MNHTVGEEADRASIGETPTKEVFTAYLDHTIAQKRNSTIIDEGALQIAQ